MPLWGSKDKKKDKSSSSSSEGMSAAEFSKKWKAADNKILDKNTNPKQAPTPARYDIKSKDTGSSSSSKSKDSKK